MRKIISNNYGWASYIGAVVAVLVTIAIGIVVFYKIAGSTGGGLPADAVTALANINTTASSVFTLAPIVGLVLIASIIIGAILMFAGGRRM